MWVYYNILMQKKRECEWFVFTFEGEKKPPAAEAAGGVLIKRLLLALGAPPVIARCTNQSSPDLITHDTQIPFRNHSSFSPHSLQYLSCACFVMNGCHSPKTGSSLRVSSFSSGCIMRPSQSLRPSHKRAAYGWLSGRRDCFAACYDCAVYLLARWLIEKRRRPLDCL